MLSTSVNSDLGIEDDGAEGILIGSSHWLGKSRDFVNGGDGKDLLPSLYRMIHVVISKEHSIQFFLQH